jgi:hypothetical protein
VKQAHGLKATASLTHDDPAKVYEDYYLPRRAAWLRKPESERGWTPEALAFASAVLAGTFQHERKHRVSPSSMGTECERELLFGYAGAPQVLRPPLNEEKMGSGSFEHLRWQMQGLTAGFLDECEVWMHSEELRCGGSADGVGDDGSLFEFKNTAPHLYKAIVEDRGSARDYGRKMHYKHRLQMEAYWLIDSLQPEPRLSEWGSLIYQNRDTKEMKEFRIRTTPELRNEVHRILEGLHDWIDLDELPDMLEGCIKVLTAGNPSDKELRAYGQCPYREYCPTAHSVTVVT